MEDGRLYRGEFRDGVPCGVGRVLDPDTSATVYVGDFRGGVRHGFGWELFKTEIYVGHWRDGERSGLGLLRSLRGPDAG